MTNNIGPALRHRLQSAQDYDMFDVNIFLIGEPAAEQLVEAYESTDSEAVEDIDPMVAVKQIQDYCTVNQKELIEFLERCRSEADYIDDGVSIPQVGAIDSFWINNAVATDLSYATLQSVLKRPDVAYVELSRNVDLEEVIDAKTSPVQHTSVRPRRSRDSVGVAVATSPPTWSVKRINAPLLWQLDINGNGILVAVIDTGVNYKHPDLKNHMWDGGANYPNHGEDFVDNDNNPMDEHGHGTCSAGQVAGDGSKGKSTGVAPKATIMALRAENQERQYWKAFEFAIQNQVDVISMSMSWKYPLNPDYPGWRRSCETILAAGIVHANSIGNQGSDLDGYPIPYNIATPGNCPPPKLHSLQPTIGGLSSVIACGATDNSDKLAKFSGRGPAAWENVPYTDYPYANGNKPGLLKPDVCAPGPGTISCNNKYPQDANARPYTGHSGTSAATPHVAGCLALLAHACRRHEKPIVPARLQEALEATAVRIVDQTRCKENHFGSGRVDVYATYKYGEVRNWWK